jgi:chemotaxis protein MotB
MSGRGGRRGGGGHAEGHGSDERWVISYADLVTLLLGFFIILYATSELDLQRFESISIGLAKAFNVDVKQGLDPEDSPLFQGGRGLLPGPLNTGRIDRDLAFIEGQLGDHERAQQILPGQVEVKREEDRIVFRVADSLVFASASAELRPGAHALLQVIGEIVSGLPNEIRVEGHTDTVPVATARYPSNWELSSARATAVLRHLVEDVGLDGSRVFAAGYGEFRPIASNETPEGRALNRRADIVVLYEPGQLALSGDVTADEPAAPDITPDLRPDLNPGLVPGGDDAPSATADEPAGAVEEE